MSVLNRKRFGLVLRTFATKEADVPNRVAAIKKMVEKACGLQVGGRPFFARVDVLVWADARYKDADCGKTADALRDEFHGTGVQVHEFKHGDVFCGILNYGIALQTRNRVDYSLVASTEAQSYLTLETVEDMLAAIDNGALAVGVAINELTQSVMEGRLANTMCLWHNLGLMSAGGFDLRAAKPVDDRVAHYMKGWSAEKGEVFYHLAGCEEVIPLVRLVEAHGPCLAAIRPRGEGTQTYVVPDPVTQPELYARHLAKMGTKFERQSALLAAIGCDLSYLKGGILPAYR